MVDEPDMAVFVALKLILPNEPGVVAWNVVVQLM